MAYDFQIAALTVYCEASGEPQPARIAVAAVMLNRLRLGYEKTLAAVCLKRKQFSEWNDDPRNNANLLRGARLDDGDRILLDCEAAVRSAYSGLDPTSGATHYHDTSVTPAWTKDATRTAQIGNLVFWKNVK